MNNRRGFLGSLTGMIGIGATVKAVEPQPVAAELKVAQRTLTEEDLRNVAKALREEIARDPFPVYTMGSVTTTCRPWAFDEPTVNPNEWSPGVFPKPPRRPNRRGPITG